MADPQPNSLRQRLGEFFFRTGMRFGAAGRPVKEGNESAAAPKIDHTGPLSSREGLLEAANGSESILEIGPFHAPALRGENVFFFDLQPHDELVARVRDYGLPTDRVPPIHYFEPTGDLSKIDRRFAAVFSSHCIEHQPSLIRHLTQVSALLEPGGAYYLIVPDKRYCFDHYLPLSTLGGVIEAHHDGRRVHSLANLIDARTMVTHNKKLRHWTADHGDPPQPEQTENAARSAIAEYEAANGAYIDIHAWRFTPERFFEITEALHGLGLTDLAPQTICATQPGQLEFTALLRKTA
ncbi:MAG: class I SAM-dependent methyltransferase [Mangrovicoccus sp.]|nr:class I SAM-dependent methyltransferase [Mangrovicoccus sp.]